MIIESSWGQGEEIVSGEVDPDRFVMDSLLDPVHPSIKSKKINRRKTKLGTLDPAGGIRSTSVDPERASQPSISDSQACQLACIAARLSQFLDQKPLDIEFALDQNGKLYVLQTREITTKSMDDFSFFQEFELPLDGTYTLDVDHSAYPYPRIHCAFFPPNMIRGMIDSMKKFHIPMEGISIHHKNGFLYTCMRPKGAPKKPCKLLLFFLHYLLPPSLPLSLSTHIYTYIYIFILF